MHPFCLQRCPTLHLQRVLLGLLLNHKDLSNLWTLPKVIQSVLRDVVWPVLFNVPVSTVSLTYSTETMFPSFTRLYQIVDAMAFISLLLISVLLLSYLLIPTKSQANMQKISGTIALWILISIKCFTMFQSYSKTLCQSAFLGATFRNPRCGVQAVLLTFGTHAVALWASMRAYTVLALITYQKSFTSLRWRVAMNVVCWGIPLLVAVAAIATRMVGYGFGAICGPRANLQPAFFSIPILVLHGGGFALITAVQHSGFLC